jgi:hypothetical protein
MRFRRCALLIVAAVALSSVVAEAAQPRKGKPPRAQGPRKSESAPPRAPEEQKPNEPKASEPKPSEPKPNEPKASEPKPSEPKPNEPKASEPKPSEPGEAKPGEPGGAGEAKPSEPSPGEAPPDAEPPAEPPPEPEKKKAAAPGVSASPAKARGGKIKSLDSFIARHRHRVSRCAVESGGLEESKAELAVEFLVRGRGRAEGIEVDAKKGASAALARCVRAALKDQWVGVPDADPVAVSFWYRLDADAPPPPPPPAPPPAKGRDCRPKCKKGAPRGSARG